VALYADCRQSDSRCCVLTCSSNLLTTTHSIIFDTKLRLEIGRYELTSSGSSDDLFSRGRTMACFKAFGKIPSRTGAFTISARVPASEVGAGSNEQCFAGAQPTIVVISSAVVSRNTDRLLHCRIAITAEDSPEVGARIVSTLERKITTVLLFLFNFHFNAVAVAQCQRYVSVCLVLCVLFV